MILTISLSDGGFRRYLYGSAYAKLETNTKIVLKIMANSQV